MSLHLMVFIVSHEKYVDVHVPLFFNYQVLECFELQPNNSVFLELIPIFPKVCIYIYQFGQLTLGCIALTLKKYFTHVITILCSLMLLKYLDLSSNIISAWK